MPTDTARRRDGERGAALITSLLVAMMLLAAGGALIATTGMAASNAVDATAEAQAYYAADAGLQAALNVIRRNKAATNPAVDADFHNIVCNGAGACNNTGTNNLSLWLTYTGSVVKMSDAPYMAFEIAVHDPSLAIGGALAATYQPRYLHVKSTGRGPKGATKILEMMVDRFKFSYDAPAPLVLRESQDGLSHVVLAPGAGQPNVYSGTDVANPSVTKPAVGVGETVFLATTDLAIASAAMSAETMTGGVGAVGNATTPWPSIVADAPTAASTVEGLRDFAESTGCPANNQALSDFTFIEGDCTLGPNNSGSGFLVITGTLTTSGNFNFSGLILALGEGRLVRGGGGGGIIEGGILAANFTGDGSGGFGQVIFDTSGGGNSQIRYNSLAIENALAQYGPKALGIVEK